MFIFISELNIFGFIVYAYDRRNSNSLTTLLEQFKVTVRLFNTLPAGKSFSIFYQMQLAYENLYNQPNCFARDASSLNPEQDPY